jgi:hypothetical protein
LKAPSTHRIIQDDEKLLLYNFQMQQALCDADKAGKVISVVTFRCFGDSPAVLQIIWFGNNDYFHLNGHVNKWNMHVWASEQPHNSGVWCGTLCQAVLLGQHFSMIL